MFQKGIRSSILRQKIIFSSQSILTFKTVYSAKKTRQFIGKKKKNNRQDYQKKFKTTIRTNPIVNSEEQYSTDRTNNNNSKYIDNAKESQLYFFLLT